MIRAMNEVQALQDMSPKRRHSAEKLLIVLIALVSLSIGAVVMEIFYPEAVKDVVQAVSKYL